GKFLKYLRLI
ncbi:hypothetical protein N499_0885B, partial [Wolbachia pipientis wVitA]